MQRFREISVHKGKRWSHCFMCMTPSGSAAWKPTILPWWIQPRGLYVRLLMGEISLHTLWWHEYVRKPLYINQQRSSESQRFILAGNGAHRLPAQRSVSVGHTHIYSGNKVQKDRKHMGLRRGRPMRVRVNVSWLTKHVISQLHSSNRSVFLLERDTFSEEWTVPPTAVSCILHNRGTFLHDCGSWKTSTAEG